MEKSSIKKLKAITHGSVFDTITRDTFANITVFIPDKKLKIILQEFCQVLIIELRIISI